MEQLELRLKLLESKVENLSTTLMVCVVLLAVAIIVHVTFRHKGN